MSAPWTAECVVDEELARSLIDEQQPDLAPARVERLGAGFDNTAYLVNGSWVFRFPRRQVAVPLLEREAAALPRLAPRLPLPIPVPERLGRPGARFGWPWSGYRLLPGRTACGARLDEAARAAAAPTLGRFLAALHAVPVDEAGPLPGDELGRMDVPMRRERARAMLADVDAPGRARLEAILDGAPRGPRPPAVVVHGDLYGRHLLVDAGGAPCGVIDWGDLHVGDRAVDLAVGPAFLPPAARDAFRAAYGGVDDDTWGLARFRAIYHAVLVMRYASSVGDGDLLREARLALEWA